MLAVVVALAVTAAAAGSFFSPVLDLDRIVVHGVDGAREADVIRAAAVSRGEALVAVDPAEVRSRIEALPFVAHAGAELEWPDGLVLTVSAHRPVARVAVGGGNGSDALTHAAEVVPLEEVGSDALPLIRLDRPIGDLSRGDRLALLSLVESLEAVLGRRLGDLIGQPGGRYSFEGLGDIDGAEVALGDLGGVTAKSQALRAMLGGAVDLECMADLDVSVPTRVTITRDSACLAQRPVQVSEGEDR